jgi:hypothetical protein
MYISVLTQILILLLLVFTPTSSGAVFWSKIMCFIFLFFIDIFEVVPHYVFYVSTSSNPFPTIHPILHK